MILTLTAIGSHQSEKDFFISSETLCASSILLAFTTIPEYSFDLANPNTIALPIPLLDPVTTAIFLFSI
jgi:hypothetical protein